MTLEEFAAMLDGREYLSEIAVEEAWEAARLGYVVIFGYSDDCMEIAGFVDDELGCYEGRKFAVVPGRKIYPCEDIPRSGKELRAVWDEDGYAWTFKTDIYHATFDIFEEGEKYCRGIVFEWPWREDA